MQPTSIVVNLMQLSCAEEQYYVNNKNKYQTNGISDHLAVKFTLEINQHTLYA